MKQTAVYTGRQGEYGGYGVIEGDRRWKQWAGRGIVTTPRMRLGRGVQGSEVGTLEDDAATVVTLVINCEMMNEELFRRITSITRRKHVVVSVSLDNSCCHTSCDFEPDTPSHNYH